MSACKKCGTERTLSGYCGAQAQHYADLLTVEQRLGDLRSVVLAVEGAMRDAVAHDTTPSGGRTREWARALREACGETP